MREILAIARYAERETVDSEETRTLAHEVGYSYSHQKIGNMERFLRPEAEKAMKNPPLINVGMLGADIIENERMERATALLSAIVDSSDDAIISKNLDGIITSWNKSAERLFGYTAAEAVGRSTSMLIPSDRLDEEPKILEQLRRGERVSHFETIRRRKDGSLLDISLTISPIKDSFGRVIGASKIARDITERRLAEALLLENEQKLKDQAKDLEQQLIASGRLVSIGQVTASMAHEFNNPLGIIIGFVEDMLSKGKSGESDQHTLRIIIEESRRCKKIVEDLMSFARPRAAEMSLINIQGVIDRTLELVNGQLYKQKVKVLKEIASDLPRIEADFQQLSQVLVNLYLNAIDAMPKGGQLKIGARSNGGDNHSAVVLNVADTGTGIEATEIDKIFRPFYTAKKSRGLGLGLSICERIIKNHGGEIDVESKPGKGTTFKLRLPLKASSNSYND